MVLPEVLGATCTSAERVAVVVPHPDDEALCCAGVLQRAVDAGMCVRVIIVTNGDHYGDGRARARLREGESVAALALAGVAEDDVVFLGYPDFFLGTLAHAYRRNDSAFTAVHSGTHAVAATYAYRGLGRTDYHHHRTGAHAAYNYANLVADLAAALAEHEHTCGARTVVCAHCGLRTRWGVFQRHLAHEHGIPDCVLERDVRP